MSFFKRITRMFRAPDARGADASYWFTVQCSRCGELIRGRVDTRNDLSVEYADSGEIYYCRKVLIGEQRCFQPVEVELRFDAQRRLVGQDVRGGKFIAEERAA